MEGIVKAFGGVVAADDVSIDLRRGEVHAVVGENGAGKTTLMRMLAGTMAPDAGVIRLDGKPVTFAGRLDGRRHGIGFVQQHYGLVPEMSGAENLMLGYPDLPFRLRPAWASDELRRLGDSLGFEVHPERRVERLSMGERQRLEILIALSGGADVLILDEPTAALGTADAEILEGVIRGLAARGHAVVYISHKLKEVVSLADRITVMRRGKVVGSHARGTVSVERLAEEMVGRLRTPERVVRVAPGERILSLRDVYAAGSDGQCGIEAITLTVHRGQTVGVAGVSGSGQETLAEVVVGLAVPSAGEVERASDTTAYIPEDRDQSLARRLSLADNVIVHRHAERELRRFGRLDRTRVQRFVAEVLRRSRIVEPRPNAFGETLSGGNQQRLVLARELERDPDLIIAHNPYRGLDLGAIDHVRHELLAARSRGCGIVFLSSDLDELLDLSDTIVILVSGRVSGTVDPKTVSATELGRLIGGAQ
ncbi:MAG: ATP-binding cassette domain-containing protein [Solirubrobacteraceae bacterium]